MAKICKKCKGYGALHKVGQPDNLCQFCPPPQPSVARKWTLGRSCVMDQGKVYEINGVLAKAPFLNQFKEWFVIVATVEEDMMKDGTYAPKRFNTKILQERVTLK